LIRIVDNFGDYSTCLIELEKDRKVVGVSFDKLETKFNNEKNNYNFESHDKSLSSSESFDEILQEKIKKYR